MKVSPNESIAKINDVYKVSKNQLIFQAGEDRRFVIGVLMTRVFVLLEFVVCVIDHVGIIAFHGNESLQVGFQVNFLVVPAGLLAELARGMGVFIMVATNKLASTPKIIFAIFAFDVKFGTIHKNVGIEHGLVLADKVAKSARRVCFVVVRVNTFEFFQPDKVRFARICQRLFAREAVRRLAFPKRRVELVKSPHTKETRIPATALGTRRTTRNLNLVKANIARRHFFV